MKFTFDGMEIEIKAKNQYSNRANKADTLSFLNTLSIYAAETANRYRNIGMNALAERADELNEILYDLCDENGVYDNL